MNGILLDIIKPRFIESSARVVETIKIYDHITSDVVGVVKNYGDGCTLWPAERYDEREGEYVLSKIYFHDHFSNYPDEYILVVTYEILANGTVREILGETE